MWTHRRCGCRSLLPARSSVDLVLQGLRGGEANALGSTDHDRLAGLRIAAFTGGAVLCAELAKAVQGDLVALHQRIADKAEDGIERFLRISLRNALRCCKGVNDVSSVLS